MFLPRQVTGLCDSFSHIINEPEIPDQPRSRLKLLFVNDEDDDMNQIDSPFAVP